MHPSWRGFLFFFAALVAATAHARKTDFSENHSGLVIGVGTYPTWPSGADPLPSMVPLGVTVNGSSSARILPVRAGIFIERGPISAEFFFKYFSSTSSTWGTAGDWKGSGESQFRSKGFGAQAGFDMYRGGMIKAGLLGRYEMILQRVKHQYKNEGEELQKITLAHNTSLYGAGFQSEFWLGDMWVLNGSLLYQYGQATAWKAADADHFLNRNWEKGAIQNPRDGKDIKASFSGILIEIGLKLNFYSF